MVASTSFEVGYPFKLSTDSATSSGRRLLSGERATFSFYPARLGIEPTTPTLQVEINPRNETFWQIFMERRKGLDFTVDVSGDVRSVLN